MYKEIQVNKEVVEHHKYCDVCGCEINIGLSCSAAKCMYCGKDLCEEHVGHEEDTFCDSRTVYCEKCWSMGESFRPEIKDLGNQIESLYQEWQDKCKH